MSYQSITKNKTPAIQVQTTNDKPRIETQKDHSGPQLPFTKDLAKRYHINPTAK